ncbi:MAG TPA: hypothetical protein PKA63_03595 [Oligoflexia bacterium]|nr:hypothetical protein [Oligoflexia bacterium]HMP47738.1 hypothetical protein [Oligoflexia bacterium]
MNISKKLFIFVYVVYFCCLGCTTSGYSTKGTSGAKSLGVDNSSTGDSSLGVSSDISSDVFDGFKDEGNLNEVFVIPVLVRRGLHGSANNQLGVADKSLTEILIRALDIHTDLNVITDVREIIGRKNDTGKMPNSGNEGTSVYEIPVSGLGQKALFGLAKRLSEETGVQSVLYAMVDQENERTGGGLGSEKSSEFRYRLWLYGSKSESVIWSSAYRSKQGTLTDNIFSARGRFTDGLAFRPFSELIEEGFRGSSRALNTLLRKKASVIK